VLRWASDVERISISAVTIEEIRFGLAWKPHKELRDWFDRFFATACEVLPIGDAIAERSGILRGQLRRAGVTLTQADCLIAATAQVHNLTLVTRNVRDFARSSVELLNPFV
jgi:predicted nucleic acid-binding protein